MNLDARETLIRELENTHKQMSALLASIASDQDWQPDAEHWSFRYIAAHMAACDKECLQTRIIQIASGENLHFEFYSNTGRDFSGLDTQQSLDEWEVTRHEIIEFFRTLPDEKLSLTGSHKTFGLITVPDYLRIGLDHDREHLQELEHMLADYGQHPAKS